MGIVVSGIDLFIVSLVTVELAAVLNELTGRRYRILRFHFLGSSQSIELLSYLTHFPEFVCLRRAVIVLVGTAFYDLLQVGLVLLCGVV